MASEKGYFYENTKKRAFFFSFFLEHSENGIDFDISSTLFRACFAILCSNISAH